MIACVWHSVLVRARVFVFVCLFVCVCVRVCVCVCACMRNSLAPPSSTNARHATRRDATRTRCACTGVYSTYMYAEEAKHIIRTTTEPYFIYMAAQSIHTPLEAPQAYMDLYNDGRVPNASSSPPSDAQMVFAMVTALDDLVGNITGAVKASGQWDRTLIVFSSDNVRVRARVCACVRACVCSCARRRCCDALGSWCFAWTTPSTTTGACAHAVGERAQHRALRVLREHSRTRARAHAHSRTRKHTHALTLP